MRAEEILTAARDLRLREVVEAAVVERGGVLASVTTRQQRAVPRAISAALAAKGHESCPPLSDLLRGAQTRERVRGFTFPALGGDTRWAIDQGVARTRSQALQFDFERVQGTLLEEGEGVAELRHVARFLRAEAPERGEANWMFVDTSGGVTFRGQLSPVEEGGGYRSEWLDSVIATSVMCRGGEANFVDTAKTTWLRTIPLESRLHRLKVTRGDEIESNEGVFLAAMPKVLLAGLPIAAMQDIVGFYGLPAARILSSSLNRGMAMVGMSSGDFAAAWRKFHGVAGEERDAVYGVEVRRGDYFPATLAPGTTVDSSQERVLTNEVTRLEAEERVWGRRHISAQEALKAARKAVEDKVPREELYKQAIERGSALKIKVDSFGTHILLPPLVFRETEVIRHLDRVYPPGRYRLPDAWAFVPRGRNGIAVQVLTVDGFLHPHPHVQFGPGSGLLCTGETGEVKARNEAALMTAWEGDVAGWCDYLHNFLLSVWGDGLNNRYWPLVAVSERIGDL